MISNKLQMTAQNPSCIGMPVYGSAFGTARSAAQLTAVRDRRIVVATSLKGDFPGTRAWRPPTC
jgi:hypothetical protein